MKKWTRRGLGILIVLYILLFSIVALNRHYTFRTNGFDLGWFTQAIWTTSQGHGILYTTIVEHQICVNTHFGTHFSPILLFLVPFYKLFPRPETLLIIQTVVIGLSAYPLFLLSKEILKDEMLSLGLVVLYLMNSLLHGINGYDFHATPFAMPFIFLTALYLERRQYSRAWVSALFVLLAKEDAGLALISLGGFYLLRQRDILEIHTYLDIIKKFFNRSLNPFEKNIISLTLVGFLWTLTTWKLIIPAIAGIHITSSVYYHNFPCPEYISMKILYFVVANLTLGLLTFLRPKYYFLLTFVPWLEILSSCQINMFRIGFQYPYMILPLSMIAVIYALREIRNEELKKIVSIGMIVGIIVSILTTPVLPLRNGMKEGLLVPPDYYYPVTHHHKILMEITQILGQTEFSILTQNDIFPHLANRINTYVIWGSYCGNTLPKAEIILLDRSLLYSVHIFAVEPYLVNYTKIYEYDGIEIWMRNDTISSPDADSLLKELEGIK